MAAPLHVDSEEYPARDRFDRRQRRIARFEDYAAVDAALRPGRRGIDLPVGLSDSVVAAGHSNGALIAQVAAGARLALAAGAEPVRCWRHPAAVVALSPPPPMPDLIDASGWSDVDVPSLCVTGTADVMPGFVSDWREHCRSYEAAMRAPAYALIFRGMDHYFNGAFGRLADSVDPASVAALQEHCAAFVQGVLANRPPHPERWRERTSRRVTALARLCS